MQSSLVQFKTAFRLGQSADKLEDHQAAIQHFGEAVHISERADFLPHRTEHQEILLQLYFSFSFLLFYERQQYQEVIDILHKSVALDPSLSHVYSLQSMCFLELEQWGYAEVALHKAIKIDPRPSHWIFLASAYEGNGKTEDEVIFCVKQALVLDPDYEEAHYLLGRWLFLEHGDDETAEFHLKRAVALDREYEIAHSVLGQLYKERAVESMKVVVDDFGDFDMSLGLSVLHLAQAVQLGSDDIFVYGHLLNSYWMQGKIRKANEIGRKMIQKFHEASVSYWMYGGFLAGTSGNMERAESLLQRGIELDPACGEAYLTYGRALLSWDRHLEANQMFDKADSLEVDDDGMLPE